MTTYVFTNNANSVLAAPIASGDTTLTVTTGQGAIFPAPVGDEVFTVTLEDTLLGTREVVLVSARAGDSMTIARGQEGTTPQGFAQGAVVSHRLTAGALDWLASLSTPAVGGVIYRTPNSGDIQIITPGSAADQGIVVKGRAGQVASLQEWQNSAGTVLAKVAADGAMTLSAALQSLRVKTTQAGTEAVPSLLIGGDANGLRLFGSRFAVVVDNTDAAIFEPELQPVGSLDSLSIITKRLGDLLYFPITGGTMTSGLKLAADGAYVELNDTVGAQSPGYNKVRLAYNASEVTLKLYNDADALLATLLQTAVNASGATAHSLYVAGSVAARVDAAGTAAGATTTVMTREKGDARFAPIAHASDTNNPHAVTATQVTATGGVYATVQAAVNAVAAIAASYVSSFNSRTGAVVPLAADYAAHYLSLAGGTLTGFLTLNANGTNALHAVTKQQMEAADALKANLASPTFTGTLTAAIATFTSTLTASATALFSNIVRLGTSSLTSSTGISLPFTGASKKTLTLAHTTTITINNMTADQTVELWITKTTGGGTITWAVTGGTLKWKDNVAPTLTTTNNKVDLIVFVVAGDGSTVYGAHGGTFG